MADCERKVGFSCQVSRNFGWYGQKLQPERHSKWKGVGMTYSSSSSYLSATAPRISISPVACRSPQLPEVCPLVLHEEGLTSQSSPGLAHRSHHSGSSRQTRSSVSTPREPLHLGQVRSVQMLHRGAELASWIVCDED